MNGTRLAKFMESVDEVTGAMGTAEEASAAPVAAAQAPAPRAFAEVDEAVAAARPPAAVAGTEEVTEATASSALPPATSAADPWAPLLEAGFRWIASLDESEPPPAAHGRPGERRPPHTPPPPPGAPPGPPTPHPTPAPASSAGGKERSPRTMPGWPSGAAR